MCINRKTWKNVQHPQKLAVALTERERLWGLLLSTFYISVLFEIFITRTFYFHNQDKNLLEGIREKIGRTTAKLQNSISYLHSPNLLPTPPLMKGPVYSSTMETFLHNGKNGPILQQSPLPSGECENIRVITCKNEEKLPQNSPAFPGITESLPSSFSWPFFAFFLTGPSLSSGLFLLLSISATYVRKWYYL